MTDLRGYNNIVTSSGTYKLFPSVYIAGLVSSGGASVVVEGEGVTAYVTTSWSLLGLLTGYSITAQDGATVQIGSGSSLISSLSNSKLTASGGTIIVEGSIIAALSTMTYVIESGGTLEINNILTSAEITALSGSSLTFKTGGGTLRISPSTGLSLLTLTNISGFDITGATIEIVGATKIVNVYAIGTNSAILMDNGFTLVVSGDYYDYVKNLNLYQVTEDGNLYISSSPTNSINSRAALVCYLKDTLIETPGGERPIQDLNVGDVISVHRDNCREEDTIIWKGRARAKVKPLKSKDVAGYPIRIKKGAVATGIPHSDILVTPEHCLYLKGKFVPVRMLVNEETIFYDERYLDYDYFHIETERHAIIRANGVFTETFLDNGNRGQFTEQSFAPSHRKASQPRSWETDAAAPLEVKREFVEPIFTALQNRAPSVTRGKAKKDVSKSLFEAEVHLETESGDVITRCRKSQNRLIFQLPPQVERPRIVSRATRPSDMIGPFVDDRRHLGVLIGEVCLYESAATRPVDVHLRKENLDGWNNIEPSPCRWTSGKATLPLGNRRTCSRGILSIEIIAAGPMLES